VREDLESYRSRVTWLVARGRLTDAAHIAWALVWFWAIGAIPSKGSTGMGKF
jgi:hypothetical protein